MEIIDALEELYEACKKDAPLKERLLETQNGDNSIISFCKIAGEAGITISALDLIYAGEEAYAAMRRSTNGGGENAPLLDGEDDYYELFLARLRAM